MTTAEIAIGALAAALGTAGAVTMLGPGGTGPKGVAVAPPPPVAIAAVPVAVGPTGSPPPPAPVPTGPPPPAINRLAQVNAQQAALGVASKNPFAMGTNPFAAPPVLALGPAGSPSPPVRALGTRPLAPRSMTGGRRRVSTLRRKPKTRSKNGRRSTHKSTVRRYR